MEERFEYHGFEGIKLDFEETYGHIVFPKEKANNKIVYKMVYWGAFPDMEIEFLKRGFHLIFLKTKTRLATKAECEQRGRFLEFISEKYGLEKTCVVIGMSCGGAVGTNFAGYLPQYVDCLVIDAPVLNFLDFPGAYDRWEDSWDKEFTVAYPGVKRPDVFKLDENPINRAPQLIEAKIPVIMLYGTEDGTVHYELNGRLLEEAYSDNKELLTVVPRHTQGHHPHGLLDKSYTIAEMVMETLLHK